MENENEVKASIQEVTDFQINCKLVTQKEGSPRIITSVKFEYEGHPSVMEPILILASTGKPIFVKFYSPQLAMNMV